MKRYKVLGRDGSRDRAAGFPRNYILLVAILVATTLSYTWKKVEVASVVKQIEALEVQVGKLEEERSKLMAAIALRKKPGVIKKTAEEKLGMVYPRGRVVELTVDRAEGGMAK